VGTLRFSVIEAATNSLRFALLDQASRVRSWSAPRRAPRCPV